MNRTKPEVLAPAGSMEALKAAVAAGADAIYLGGNRFGARAFANNFQEQELIDAIEYAHIYGVKVYLTINTLFRDEELNDLYDYLKLPYIHGLDAVIVQDFGVLKYVHTFFPDLAIHASTQMTITTPYAYQILKEYGVTRVVPARELSIDEISDLKCDSDFCPETEIFVQGALCYCYSGQCLMSSVLGGRSGNRGRCAQTCRLPYKVSFEDQSKDGYLLSPKDLCGLRSISSLISAGVDSFKIEGRMKKPEYVAVCVRAYRECIDAYFEERLNDDLIEYHTKCMAEVFNRGGFTEGYYNQHNGKQMMSTKAPGNIGVPIGKIILVQKNKITIELSDCLNKGDILMINPLKDTINLTSNCDGNKGQRIVLNAPKSNSISVGSIVSRMHNVKLHNEIHELIDADKKQMITGELELIEGKQATFKLTTYINQKQYSVVCYGDVVETASSNAITEDIVCKKVLATGNTRYVFDDFSLKMSDKPFYSMKALKDIRRNALAQLEEQILSLSKRQISNDIYDYNLFSNDYKFDFSSKEEVEVMISTKEQFDIVSAYDRVDSYIFDMNYFNTKEVIDLFNKCTGKVYIALPTILRKHNINETKQLLNTITNEYKIITGVLARNIDEFALLYNIGYTGSILFDYSLYVMNQWAYYFVKDYFAQVKPTFSIELNEKQLVSMSNKHNDYTMLVYGYQQLMVSAQCIRNTISNCNRGNGTLIMNDRYNKSFTIKSICKYCYSLIYNGLPTVLFDIDKPSALDVVSKRLHFTIESGEQTKKILDCFVNGKVLDIDKTRGHYKRGVD